MKQLIAAAIILFLSATMSFAGNFTPMWKNKVAQSQACFDNCRTAFDLCVRLRGGSTVGRIAKLSKASALWHAKLIRAVAKSLSIEALMAGGSLPLQLSSTQIDVGVILERSI